MPLRAYRVTIPVLVEDVNNSHALAVQDKLAVIVDAHSPLEAARRLERAWQENLPVGLTMRQRFERCAVPLSLRVHWEEEHGGGVHLWDGRYEAFDRDREVIRITPVIDFEGAVVADDGARSQLSTTFPGATFEIPLSNVLTLQVYPVHGQPHMELFVAGRFTAFIHEEGGVGLSVPDNYIPQPVPTDHPALRQIMEPNGTLRWNR